MRGNRGEKEQLRCTSVALIFPLACLIFHSSPTQSINLTQLKFPTGRRQTSWLFTKRDRGFELGTTEKQIPLVAGWRPSTRDLQMTKPLSHAASLIGMDMTPHRLLCCRFLFTFFGLDCAQNRIFFFCTEEHFGYLIHAQYQCTSSKQKIVYRCGSSNINLSIYVCSVDVCRASKPFPYINLVPYYQELEQTSIKKIIIFILVDYFSRWYISLQIVIPVRGSKTKGNLFSFATRTEDKGQVQFII